MNSGRPRRRYRAKGFSLMAALTYAADHVRGCNIDSIGWERSSRGNPDGAARLCAWALRRHVERFE